MRRCVIQQQVPDISKHHTAFISKVKQSQNIMKIKALHSFKTQ